MFSEAPSLDELKIVEFRDFQMRLVEMAYKVLNNYEFFKKAKELEFISRTTFAVQGRDRPLMGFKVIKEKEAGDLFNSGRIE